MSNIYTNTGIVDECWNSRGIITHNLITSNMVMTDRNVLYAAFRDATYRDNIKIKMSDDNGFNWKTIKVLTDPPGTYRQNSAELNHSGPSINLILTKADNGREQNLGIYVGYKYLVNPLTEEIGYKVSYAFYAINEDNTIGSGEVATAITGHDFEAYSICNNDNSIYVVYSYFDELRITRWNYNYPSFARGTVYHPSEPKNWFNLFDTYCNSDETVDVIGIRNYGDYHLTYTKFDLKAGGFGNAVTIKSATDIDFSDLNIGRDGYGNLLALWHEVPNDNTYSKIFYSMSIDDGVTWTTALEIKGQSNNSDFIDAPLGKPTSRTILLSGLQGFLIGYVKNEENIGTAYVRTLISANGTDYVLSQQRKAASHPTKDVTGVRFFEPAAGSKVNLENVANIRFAYQLGQGNSPDGLDTVPVYFGQKLLNDEAYIESLYAIREVDAPLQNQLLCSFNLLGSTAENIDYYTEGLIGSITDKYVASFNRFGTSVEINRYEPIGQSYLDNKLAYTKTETIFIRAFLDDINYSSPELSLSQNFQDYIERDTRQIHLPPTVHLARTFLINNGNKLKRTVWTLKFGGNEYELTQVVPKFVDNQIVYYTSNAYVIGPSRDPFSRVILPSET